MSEQLSQRGEQYEIPEGELAKLKITNYEQLLDSEGRFVYNPAMFSKEFNGAFDEYIEAVEKHDRYYRLLPVGAKNDYIDESDRARGDTHDKAAGILRDDLKRNGIEINKEDCRKIVAKLRDEKIPDKGEKELLKRAFLRDSWERDRN